MENENKNPQQNVQGKNNKNKPHKHKSYFISPAGEESKNAPTPSAGKNDAPAKSAPVSNQNNQATQNASNQNTAQNPAKKKKHKPKNHQSSQGAQNAAPQTEEPKNVWAEPTKSAPVQNQNKPSQKNNKPKHNHSKPTQTPTVQSASSQSNSQKKRNESENEFPKGDRLEKPAPKKLENFSASSEYEKYKDYEEFTYEELYGESQTKTADVSTQDSEETAATPLKKATIEVVGIKFKASGKTYYFAPKGITLHVGNHAVVETSRGLEFGEVVMSNTFIAEDEIIPPLRPVVRIASAEDIAHNAEIKKNEETAFKVCNEKIIAHGLDMKLIDAQYTFDNTKLLFYFTSSGRVDFRELVKDLASVFRTRIELRQIGIRDEAKMIGGLGVCGRPLCCSIFLTDFGQVSIKMAKEQNLSLNSSKISGVCGRLMCCLRYEHETYEYEIKRTPPVDTVVRTVDGVGTVIETSPLLGTIRVRLASAPEAPPKTYKREEVTILKKKQ